MSEGLAFNDLDSWRRWSARRSAARTVLSTLRRQVRRRPQTPPDAVLTLPAEDPQVLVVIDGGSASWRLALGRVVARLDPRRTAVLSRLPEAADLVPDGHASPWTPGDRLPGVDAVLSLGAFNDLAGRVRPWCRERDVRFVVAQHGLLTPWAPPSVDGDHYLAWSQADADFQTAGRPAVTCEVVGSQMLWEAARMPAADLLDDRPVMLGQLHGIELPRASEQLLYTDFCTRFDADYRPHPNEADAISRAQHAVMRRAGVRFETSGASLPELGRPVVSIFSTGTLEAAQRGLPAWVHHPDPPAWVRDFWSRYGLSPFGSAPTAAAALPDVEPAIATARAVMS
ncbi:prephenate dehydrogenase [Acidipropionibacterium acidipropionici]|uniref:prephenate dehydrogenase n=1 Tax=Acidipropionibacterium acidipropionici TaxID=1748 RepID=UPI000A9F701A|nr:prephenate dehydrogenase [Acidipropionibacterium acidipropionici]